MPKKQVTRKDLIAHAGGLYWRKSNINIPYNPKQSPKAKDESIKTAVFAEVDKYADDYKSKYVQIYKTHVIAEQYKELARTFAFAVENADGSYTASYPTIASLIAACLSLGSKNPKGLEKALIEAHGDWINVPKAD